jgi:hypothetical protein
VLPGARYLLAVSLAAAGRDEEARGELRRVPEDPFFDAAQKMAGRLSDRDDDLAQRLPPTRRALRQPLSR